MFMPSTLNCTPTTPTLSDALAETVMLPVTVAPAAGAVIATVGGVVSAGATPVPDRVTGYTFPAALMLSVPLALPPATGARATNMSHFVPGAMTPFHVPVARQ